MRARDPALALLDGDALAAIEPEWWALWRRCPASPFQSPAWLLPWVRHYAPGRCRALALRVDGRLEGLAPVFEWEGALLLAGTGPSDHGDWLLAPAAEAHAGRLFAALAALCGAGERIELRQLPPGSALVVAAAPAGWHAEDGPDEPCLVAPLSGEDGLGAASKKCRSNWRYTMRRIGREGGAVELVPDVGTEEAVSELIRLHALRWRARGERGVVDGLLNGLLRDAAAALARAGLLRLWRVRFGQRTAAALMVMAGHAAQHYYIGGFDPDDARLGPSAALVGAAMRQAAREGATEFDFLRGAEPYKVRWGAAERPRMHRRLMRPAGGRS